MANEADQPGCAKQILLLVLFGVGATAVWIGVAGGLAGIITAFYKPGVIQLAHDESSMLALWRGPPSAHRFQTRRAPS